MIAVISPFVKPSFTKEIRIDVLLPRSTGITSKGTLITLSVTDTLDHAKGRMVHTTTASMPDGKAHFSYFYADTLYQGNLKVTANMAYPKRNLAISYLLTTYKPKQ